MESDNNVELDLLDEQEVTVEVLPQTVRQIVYLQDDLTNYSDDSTNNIESYELGNVDIAKFAGKSLVLDPTQSFVLLQSDEQDGDYLNENELPYNYDETEDNRSGLGEFICTLCNFKCMSLSSLNAHRLIHDEQYIKCHYNCVACGQQFDKAQSLSHHFRSAHKVSKFVCSICKYVCSEECSLVQHLKVHEPKKYMCGQCDALFDSALKLVDHQKTHDTTLLYACNKCDASFATTSEVSLHLRTMHEKMKLPNNIAIYQSIEEEKDNNTRSEKTVTTKKRRTR